MIASTHCFDKTLVDTVVQDNINPIERVENSLLIVASTIHQQNIEKLVAKEHVQSVSEHAPLLLQYEQKEK